MQEADFSQSDASPEADDSTSSSDRASFEQSAQQIDATCLMIATGRLAARQLATQVNSLGLSEAEFRLLWVLRTEQQAHHESGRCSEPDQTRLASQLVISAAQVSSVVERLRIQGFIAGRPVKGDRRRQVWRITADGSQLLESAITQNATKSLEQKLSDPSAPFSSRMEDAA